MDAILAGLAQRARPGHGPGRTPPTLRPGFPQAAAVFTTSGRAISRISVLLQDAPYVRSILEHAARGETPPAIADITERLERIERAVTGRQNPGDQKTA